MAQPGVGHQYPARKVSWTKRDVLLFNLSIGCQADEPHFVYENHPDFSPFPTFPLSLVFKLDHEEVVDFYAAQGAVKIPGVPLLDPVRLVDGDRTLQVLKALPVTSQGRQFEFRSTVLGVYDKGNSGTVVRSEDALVDAASDEVYARNIGSLFYVGQGNWGGPRGPKSDKFPPPKGKAPDFSFTFHVDEQAAHLYRLNGDYNPLHATPEVGEQMGYGGIILHGVFAYNNIAHDFVRQLGQGQPSSLREISARFAGPVKPGDQVKVDVWRIGATRDGLDDIRWTAAVESTGRLCLSDGRAKVKCPASASKL